MKEINLTDLITTYHISKTIDLSNPKEHVENLDGKDVLSFGSVDFSSNFDEIATARVNGGQVVYATTSVETEIDKFLSRYFMGEFVPLDNPRILFEREVLQSSAFTFGSKKDLATQIINKEKLLVGKNKNKLQEYLNTIMRWRNAFAHGKIGHSQNSGCIIEFYSGKNDSLILNDEFWTKLEFVFNDCINLIKLAFNNLDSSIVIK